jgi:hypothetical protein
MRARIIRTLTGAVAAGAAGAAASALALGVAATTAAASGPALISAPRFNPPSGGPPVYTAPCPIQSPVLTAVFTTAPTVSGCSGYQASGRDFRFVQARIIVPTTPCTARSPVMYIALAGAGSDARAGIECGLVGGPARRAGASVTGDGAGLYHGFFEVLSQGATTFSLALDTVSRGDGVFFSIYFDQARGADHFTASGPGISAARSAGAGGPVYSRAYALADWSALVPVGSIRSDVPVVPAQATRVAQFLQGRFTTASGQRGTFEGTWNLNPVEVTSNGFAPPRGTVIAAPGYLWTDGNSLDGLPGDAFAVWLFS